jgi:glycosyltransferase involved in cell wall biosynthesis
MRPSGSAAGDEVLRRVMVFPDYRHANPYQRLLYAGLRPPFVAVWPEDPATALRQGRPGEIFHLHWEDAIWRAETDDAAARARTQAFLDALEGFLDRGGRFFWTLHNERPHDGRRIDLHERFRRLAAPLAECLPVHHPTALRLFRGHPGLADGRFVLLPHGHYIGVHDPPAGPREARRAAFGFGPDERVVLLFGRLDAYKGAEELLAALARARAPRWRLLIAGKLVHDLHPALAALPEPVRARVLLRAGFVPDGEVAELFDLADIVATPYRAILTSGTVMLAFSLGRPVLAPALPGLLEWARDGRNALLWEPDDPEGPARTLERFAALAPEELAALGRGARETAEAHPWEPVHEMLDALYRRGLVDEVPPRLTDRLGWFVLDRAASGSTP